MAYSSNRRLHRIFRLPHWPLLIGALLSTSACGHAPDTRHGAPTSKPPHLAVQALAAELNGRQSFRASITGQGAEQQAVEMIMEYQAPDRVRLTDANGGNTQAIGIGKIVYQPSPNMEGSYTSAQVERGLADDLLRLLNQISTVSEASFDETTRRYRFPLDDLGVTITGEIYAESESILSLTLRYPGPQPTTVRYTFSALDSVPSIVAPERIQNEQVPQCAADGPPPGVPLCKVESF